MMEKIANLFVLLSCLVGGPLKVHATQTPKHESPKYLQYVHEIIKDFAEEIERDFHFEHTGDGGMMPSDVEEIIVIFTAKRKASLEEARELEVKITEKLIKRINENEKIRPFLRVFPFTADRAKIQIAFENEYEDYYADGTIAFMLSARGNICYFTYDPIAEELADLLDEPYDEAKKHVEEHPLNRDLRTHLATPYEAYIDKLSKSFAKEAKKKWGLNCLSEGGKTAGSIEEIAFNFVALRKATIEEARKLEVEVTERLLEIVNCHEGLRPYLKEYPFKTDRTRVAIAFKTKGNKYYNDGTIAVVQQGNNKVSYSTTVPWQDGYTIRPVPLSEETYEEAKSLLTKE